MDDRTDPGSENHARDPVDGEHARVLAEVIEDQKRREGARDAAGRRPERSDTSFFVQVGLLASGTFFFYLLFFSPTWIAPDPGTEISAERTHENLRFYLFMMAKQVESFRVAEGRLPERTEEIPGVKPGTEYVQLSSGDYRIEFTDGETTLTYESSEDPATFLGDAGSVVLGGAARSEGDQ